MPCRRPAQACHHPAAAMSDRRSRMTAAARALLCSAASRRRSSCACSMIPARRRAGASSRGTGSYRLLQGRPGSGGPCSWAAALVVRGHRHRRTMMAGSVERPLGGRHSSCVERLADRSALAAWRASAGYDTAEFDLDGADPGRVHVLGSPSIAPLNAACGSSSAKAAIVDSRYCSTRPNSSTRSATCCSASCSLSPTPRTSIACSKRSRCSDDAS